MRVVVNIPSGSHPELLTELEKTSPRERAERLRMLATFGLIQMSVPNIKTTSTSLVRAINEVTKETFEMSSQEPEAVSRKHALKSKLGKSI